MLDGGVVSVVSCLASACLRACHSRTAPPCDARQHAAAGHLAIITLASPPCLTHISFAQPCCSRQLYGALRLAPVWKQRYAQHAVSAVATARWVQYTILAHSGCGASQRTRGRAPGAWFRCRPLTNRGPRCRLCRTGTSDNIWRLFYRQGQC